MENNMFKSIMIPFIIVILPQLFVISHYISDNSMQAKIISMSGVVGAILGIVSIIMILKNNFNAQAYINPAILSVFITIPVILVSFLLFFIEGLLYGTIISTIVANVIFLIKIKPDTIREKVVLLLINPLNHALLDLVCCIFAFNMFPLNIVI